MRNLEIAGIGWHPGFYSAAELEFLSNKSDLEFQREYNLSKEPIRMDLLVIKKLSDVCIENEVGHLFKKYNVIEYKSPEDSLTIDDYYKTVSYASLYKSSGETAGRIPAEEVTVSIFRESYPRKLFEELKKMGSVIKEYRPGIYYITGRKVLFDTQIIVTGQLDKKRHHSLRILSRNVREDDVEGFIREAEQLIEPGDRNNVDAVLQASVSANKEVYKRIRRRKGVMCDALKELFKEDFDKMQADHDKEMNKMKEEYDKIKEENEKKEEALLIAIKNLMESMEWTAEQAMWAMKIPDTDKEKYMAELN